jgi:hypothetical protein
MLFPAMVLGACQWINVPGRACRAARHTSSHPVQAWSNEPHGHSGSRLKHSALACAHMDVAFSPSPVRDCTTKREARTRYRASSTKNADAHRQAQTIERINKKFKLKLDGDGTI